MTINANTNDTPTVAARLLSGPRTLLHLEGFALCAAALVYYYDQGWGWGTFFLLLLAPDLTFFAYLINQQIGATVYNVVHLALLPLALFGLGLLIDSSFAQQVATIWLVHIFMDRIFGYGFKYATEFKDTHMQRI